MDLNLVGLVKGFYRRVRSGANYSVIVVDLSQGEPKTLDYFPPINDDAHPLIGDFAEVEAQTGEGRARGTGVIDPKNLQKSAPGEKRIYARDATTGAQVCELWLKNDGSVTLINGSGHIRLQADGEVNINGARITPSGDVISSTGVSMNNHPHDQGNDSDGNSQVATDPATPTEA